MFLGNRAAGKGMIAIAVLAAALAGCAPGPAGPDDSPPSDSPLPEPGFTGFAIHDEWKLGNGEVQLMDAVNCDSEYGPWHVVASGDLAALGWSSFDAYYDFTLDPSSGTGAVTGAENSLATNGDTYIGGSTGTAALADGLISLELDFDVTWASPNIIILPGQEKITGHITRELHVIAATPEECP